MPLLSDLLDAFMQAKLPHRDLPVLALQFPEVHQNATINIHAHLREFLIACGIEESSICFCEWVISPLDERDDDHLDERDDDHPCQTHQDQPFLMVDQTLIDLNLRKAGTDVPFPYITHRLEALDVFYTRSLKTSIVEESPPTSLLFYDYQQTCTLFYHYAEEFSDDLIYPRFNAMHPTFYRLYDLYRQNQSLNRFIKTVSHISHYGYAYP